MVDDSIERAMTGWYEELKELWTPISDLILSRLLWDDLRPYLLRRHPGMGYAPQLIYGWYAEAVLIALRRLADPNRRSLSLRTVLEKVRDRAPEITMQVILSRNSGGRPFRYREALAGSTIARITSPDQEPVAPWPERLTKGAVQRDINDLAQPCKGVTLVVDEYVAHRQ